MVEGTSGACALTETDTHGWEHASKACHVSAHVLTSGALLAGDLVPQPCVVFPRGDHIVRLCLCGSFCTIPELLGYSFAPECLFAP